MAEEIIELRWRRDGNGGFIARLRHAGPTYHIKPVLTSGRYGKSWRLTVDGESVPDAESCILRYVKHRACTHAAESSSA